MTAKLALLLSQKENRKVLMASLDIYRRAAQQQLAVLGQQINVKTLPIVADEKPEGITARALDMAQREGFDVLLLDTAGRLLIDDALMDELTHVKYRRILWKLFLLQMR